MSSREGRWALNAHTVDDEVGARDARMSGEAGNAPIVFSATSLQFEREHKAGQLGLAVGVEESPGETIIYEGRKFKSYRGLAGEQRSKDGLVSDVSAETGMRAAYQQWKKMMSA